MVKVQKKKQIIIFKMQIHWISVNISMHAFNEKLFFPCACNIWKLASCKKPNEIPKLFNCSIFFYLLNRKHSRRVWQSQIAHCSLTVITMSWKVMFDLLFRKFCNNCLKLNKIANIICIYWWHKKNHLYPGYARFLSNSENTIKAVLKLNAFWHKDRAIFKRKDKKLADQVWERFGIKIIFSFFDK